MERALLSGRIKTKSWSEKAGNYSIKRKNTFPLFFFFAFCLGIFSSFNLTASPKIKVITTIFPLKEFTQAVCQDKGQVELLLPPGAEVHSWRPRPTDIVRLAKADLFIYIGAYLEPWIHDLLKGINTPKLKTLEVSRNLSLGAGEQTFPSQVEEYHKLDPHIWLDFQIDQMIIEKIAVCLSDLDPQNSLFYHKNSEFYQERLQKLDREFRDTLQDCAQRIFILGGHSAFGYLAHRYNLRQITLYGLSPDSKPSPHQLVKIVDLAKKYKVKVIYFEKYVSPDLARVIAREVGAKTLVLNPGANLSQKELKSGVTFFDIMKRNLENLKDGLNCK
ncbi:MAG: metal ABC transporter solute-binding protein, Zn/Mn family [Candidatus Aminicenantales bacterium]